MRDFTKSLLSFSWAMSVFGVQQTFNLLNPSKAREAFDNVTEAIKEEFGEFTKATFRAGDNLQRGLVDVTLGIITLDGFNPSRTMRATYDMTQQAADAVSQGMYEAASRMDQRSGREEAGWGPMGGPGPAHSRQQQSQRRDPGQEQPRSQQSEQRGWGPMPR